MTFRRNREWVYRALEMGVFMPGEGLNPFFFFFFLVQASPSIGTILMKGAKGSHGSPLVASLGSVAQVGEKGEMS